MVSPVTVIVSPEFKTTFQEFEFLAEFGAGEILDFIGLEAKDVDINEAFKNTKDPETGKEWEKSERAIKENKLTLTKTRHLRDSIAFKNDGKEEVEIGTPVIYGATHQFGKSGTTKNGKEYTIPQRRFLGIGSDFGERIMLSKKMRDIFKLGDAK